MMEILTKIKSFVGLNKLKILVVIGVISSVVTLYWYMNGKIEDLYFENIKLAQEVSDNKMMLKTERLNVSVLKNTITEQNKTIEKWKAAGIVLETKLRNTEESLQIVAKMERPQDIKYVEKINTTLSEADCGQTIQFMVDEAIGGFGK